MSWARETPPRQALGGGHLRGPQEAAGILDGSAGPLWWPPWQAVAPSKQRLTG